jgi:peptide/nickel transport system permease protein
MSRFLAIRLLQGLLVLAVISVLVYALIGLMPGDPVDLMITSDPNLTPADAARLKALYGLDLPLWQRYLNWLSAALSGDLGHSRLFARPVPAILMPRLANTLALLGPAFLISLAVALPLGVWAALRPYGAADTAINLLCFAGISMPSFWLALLLIMLFSVQLGWLPASGMGPVEGGGLLDRLPHMVMPVLCLVLVTVGGYTRYVRSGMLEQLRQDYVRTAFAKGASRLRVVWAHALRNALVPVVTIVGLELGTLVSGALVVETMFAWQGMGKLVYDAIMGNDYNLALAALLLATVMTLLGNLLADIGYVALDPRVTLGSVRT